MTNDEFGILQLLIAAVAIFDCTGGMREQAPPQILQNVTKIYNFEILNQYLFLFKYRISLIYKRQKQWTAEQHQFY